MQLSDIRPEAKGSLGDIYALMARRHPANPGAAGVAAQEIRPPTAETVPAARYSRAANDA